MRLITRDDINIRNRGSNYVIGEAKRKGSLLREDELCGFFDGMNTLLSYVEKEMPTPRRECSSSSGRDGNFRTFGSFEQMMDVYQKHPSQVKEFKEIDLSLTDLDSAGQQTEFGVTGDYLDIGRFLEGDPECFGVMIDGNPRARRVNMIVNLDWVHWTTNEILNARSSRIQRLVDWLEARGVRVSVTCISSAGCAHIEVMIKDHSDTLDLNDLAVATHSDYFRRICFRFMEYSETWSPGYGAAFKLNSYLYRMPHNNEYVSEFDVIIGNNVNSVEQVDKEFDQAELKFHNTLGKDILEPSQRHMLLFKGEPIL